MRNYRIMAALIVAICASCGKSAVIEGTLEGRPDTEIVFSAPDGKADTLSTDAEGRFRYEIKGMDTPRFEYLSIRGRRCGSFIVLPGDKIVYSLPEKGDGTIEGSDESLKLAEAENDWKAWYAATLIADTREDILRAYMDYYRKSTKFVISNPGSLACIPVLTRDLEDGLPLFRQNTDALIFRTVTDSLTAVWPESPYVRALQKETERRENLMELSARLDGAEEVPFPEIELPGIDGLPVKLSEVQGKVVMLWFWTSSAEQNMFNLDSLIPIYEQFHPRGLEVYSVALDVDKTRWAGIVRNQKHPWISVCDTRGAASPYAGVYGLQTLPTAFFITDGTIDSDASVTDAESITNYLNNKI